MEMRDWDTYYKSIGRVDVTEGDLVRHARRSDASDYARIVRFTKTQAVCHKVDATLTEMTNAVGKPMVVRLMLDKGPGGGGHQVGTGGGYRSSIWQVTNPSEIAEYEEHYRVKREDQKSKAQERAAQIAREIQIRMDAMLPGYLDKTCLNEEMNLWSMTTVDAGGLPVVITWVCTEQEQYDWHGEVVDGEYPTKIVYKVDIAYWTYRWNRDNPSRSTTHASGTSELEALAMVTYD